MRGLRLVYRHEPSPRLRRSTSASFSSLCRSFLFFPSAALLFLLVGEDARKHLMFSSGFEGGHQKTQLLLLLLITWRRCVGGILLLSVAPKWLMLIFLISLHWAKVMSIRQRTCWSNRHRLSDNGRGLWIEATSCKELDRELICNLF